ncbi:hypothetical protein KC332_g8698 [Hortaea werneckii]|nr:hypothetical protein KC358_g7986 [Hortaea werneckii]KAI6831018.1 hypothetical protein KC350_g7449 [Hortaea werneckii]KAI6927394.1 hypothetical protein KC348_g8419 [Hortaea werneckii]KAI6934025.1 hypothetical protein KC341_g7874 [Hortaea werneckii]KAI6968728.1 hypothetical protein KC321_g8291 [Hortaea werneckii]
MSFADAQNDGLLDQNFEDAFSLTFGTDTTDTSFPENTHLPNPQTGYALTFNHLQPFAEQPVAEERPEWAGLSPFEFEKWINSGQLASMQEDETLTPSLDHQEQPQPLGAQAAASSETDGHSSQHGKGATIAEEVGPWPGEHSHDRLFDLYDHQPNFQEGHFGILDFSGGNVKSDIRAHFQQQPLEDENSSLPPGSFPFEHPNYNGPITPDFVLPPQGDVHTNAFSGSSQVGDDDVQSSIAPLPQPAHKLKYVHTCDPEDADLAVHFIIGHTTSKTGVFRMKFTKQIDVPRTGGVKERLWRCPRLDCKICKASRTGSHIGEKIAKDLGVGDAFSGKSRKRKVQEVEHGDPPPKMKGAKRPVLEETPTASDGEQVTTLPSAQVPAAVQPDQASSHPPAFMTPPTTTSEARLTSSPAAFNTDHSTSD